MNDPTEWMSEYQGAFENGYTPEQLTEFFRQILTTTSIELVCVWDHQDAYGPGGDSEWYILDETSTTDTPILRHLAGDLWPFLFEAPASPAATTSPGHPGTWTGSIATFARTPRWTSHPGSMVISTR